jgi:hypothetical protein
MSGPVNRWYEWLRTVPGVAVERYAGVFEALWTDAWRERVFAGASQLVLLWDKQPDGDRLLLDHLTPLDWALAVSHRALQEGCGDKDRDWSLQIVDLTFGAQNEAWALRHAASLLDAMPWVRLYAPLKLKRRAYERLEISGQGAVAWRKTPSLAESCARRGREAVGDAVRGMVRTWQGSLQRRDDHHDLNNSVGAYVLTDLLGIDAPVSEKVRVGTRAFLQRMRWTATEQPVEIERGPAAALQVEGPARVIVVDDQINEGWSGVAAHLFGLQPVAADPVMVDHELRSFASSDTGTVTMLCAKGAAPLVERLTRADFGRRNFTFRYIEPERSEATPVPELILLDLRLATARDRKAQDEQRAQILRLVDIAEKHCLKGTPGLAWPGIAARELRLIREWCAPTRHAGRGEVEAITLLARMLALATPQTPIILFSSTGRAEIKAPLRPYGNILASFEKPRALDPGQSLEAVLTALQRELVETNRMLRTGRELTTVETVSRCIAKVLPQRGDRSPKSAMPQTHVECYYDESGRLASGMTVSAIAAAYGDEGDAEALHVEMARRVIEFPVASKLTLQYHLAWKGTPSDSSIRLLPKYSDDVAEDLINAVVSKVKGWVDLPWVSLPDSTEGSVAPLWGIAAAARLSRYRESMPVKFQDWIDCLARNRGGESPAVQGKIRLRAPYDTFLDPDKALASIIQTALRRLKDLWMESVTDESQKHKRPRAVSVSPTKLPEAILTLIEEPWQSGARALVDAVLGTIAVDCDLATALEHAVATGLAEVLGSHFALMAFHAEIEPGEHTGDVFVDAVLDRRLSLVAEAAVYDCMPVVLGAAPTTYRHFFATRKFGEVLLDQRGLQDHYRRWGTAPWYEDSNREMRAVLKRAAMADRDEQLQALKGFFERGTVDGHRPPGAENALRAIGEIMACLAAVGAGHTGSRVLPYRPIANATHLPYRSYVNPREFCGPAKVESYGPSSYGPLARAIAYRRAVPGGPGLRGAVGVRLNSSEDVAGQRHLQSLADWVPRLHGGRKSPIQCLVSTNFVLAGGMRQLETYESLLKACGLVDAGRPALGVALLCGTDWRSVAGIGARLADRRQLPISFPLIYKIATSLPGLSGSEVLQVDCPHGDTALPSFRELTNAASMPPFTMIVPERRTAPRNATDVAVAPATQRPLVNRGQRPRRVCFRIQSDSDIGRTLSDLGRGFDLLLDMQLVGRCSLSRSKSGALWTLECDEEGVSEETRKRLGQYLSLESPGRPPVGPQAGGRGKQGFRRR